jgi:hypothetical protein
MASVILQLDSDTEQKLREQASLCGQTLEAYLEQLAAQTARGKNGALAAPPSDEEFDRLLDDLAAGPTGAPLPDDFRRADLYADHD